MGFLLGQIAQKLSYWITVDNWEEKLNKRLECRNETKGKFEYAYALRDFVACIVSYTSQTAYNWSRLEHICLKDESWFLNVDKI